MSTLKQFRGKETEKDLNLGEEEGGFAPVAGRYELIDVVGRGAMGSVFSARDTTNDRTVAIKIIDPHDSRHEVAVKRFLLEADIVMSLEHPRIVKVFERGECPEHGYFIAMELLEGISLSNWMEEIDVKNADYLDRLVSICVQVCDGLQSAHDSGVVHRDLKPSNVLIHSERRGGKEAIAAKILDFGVAKALDLEQTRLTKTGDICGTYEFIAPEIIRGEKATPQSDVYSLGILLYEGLTGTTPFRDSNKDVVLARAVTKECAVPKPRSLNPDIPKPLEEICLKAVERDTRRRYASVAEMAVDLRRLKESPEEEIAAYGSKGSVKTIVTVLIGIVILGLAVGIAIGLDLFSDPEQKDTAELPTASPSPEGKAPELSLLKEPKADQEAASAIKETQKPPKETDEIPLKKGPVAPTKPEPKEAVEVDAQKEKSQKPSADTKEAPPIAKSNTSKLLDEAEAALSQRDPTKAQDLFLKVVSSQPDNARAHFGLGKAYYQQGKQEAAAKSLEKAVEIRPNPGRKTYLGKVYRIIGEKKKAERILREVLESNPEYSAAEKELAKLGVAAE